eukprot:2482643-Prymnesium_polylepis.1
MLPRMTYASHTSLSGASRPHEPESAKSSIFEVCAWRIAKRRRTSRAAAKRWADGASDMLLLVGAFGWLDSFGRPKRAVHSGSTTRGASLAPAAFSLRRTILPRSDACSFRVASSSANVVVATNVAAAVTPSFAAAAVANAPLPATVAAAATPSFAATA